MAHTMNRRELLAAGAAAGLAASPLARLFAADEKRLYKIGACDWSIGKRQNIEAFDVAKAIGLDGVQVSFSEPGKPFDLRDKAVRDQYLAKSKETGVEIASLAMGVLNSVPFATEPQTEKWVEECIEVMAAMGQKIVLLAFFGKGDIRGKPDRQEAVIAKLKRLAPKAEKAGVILGVESTLNVDDHLKILNGVDSPAVQVYYDVANMHYNGYDIFAELRTLGADRICQIHCKERGCLLGKGPIDFKKVRDVLAEIGYYDWLIIEGATEKGRSMEECYVDNQKFLRSLFPTAG
ncbi:MAG: sugar phosphate isomerase/epimerase [Planctomycetota bacterium]|nr:MAG: sugar phosphate isomerase/epimerase [Planctomycetota bacterium]